MRILESHADLMVIFIIFIFILKFARSRSKSLFYKCWKREPINIP